MPNEIPTNINPMEKPPVEQTGELFTEQEIDENNPEEEFKLVPDETEAKKDLNKSKTKKANKKVVTEALRSIEEIDADLQELFEKALEEKGESSSEVEQMQELIKELPEIFKNFDQKIATLVGKDGFSKEKLAEKSEEIKNSLVESVANGHLKAEDVLSMVSEVEIYPTHSDDPGEQEKIDATLSRFGYESTMFVDTIAGKIYIFDNALKDKYVTQDGKEIKIDFRHTINHELSHILDKKADILQNKTLLDACDQLAGMEDFADTQSMHIRNTLKTEGLTQNQIRAEIIADYTALYLKSDGSFLDFASECLKMTDAKAMEEQLGLNQQEVRAILENKNDQFIENVKRNNPKFNSVLKIYETFYQEISKGVKENKGKIQPLEEGEEEEENEYGNYFSEPASASAEPPQNSRKEESFVSLFLGVVKAIGDETPGSKIGQ